MSLLRTLVPLLALVCGVLAVPSPDPSSYKDFNVSRGLNYYYYFSSPQDTAKPYLLFLHGFPSTSYDWRYQINFFADQGYGLIVPDMLGYGGTAKPLETEAYKSSLITKDIVDILDHEGAENVVAIAHDWGAKINSRLANYFQDRFLAFAFFAIGYTPPPGSTYKELSDTAIEISGYDAWGYWAFFSQDNAAEIISNNIDPFFSLLYSSDPRLSITEWSPVGALQAWLESKSTTDYFISPEEFNTSKSVFLESGITASLNWYKIMTSDIDRLDNQGIPESNATINKPVFFGGATRDYISIIVLMRAPFFKYAPDFTFQDYDADHWVMIQRPDEVNKDLLEWLENSVL
ncbi:Alpha/Beta hydrolase protein [Mucidula mucida]|nr:Alpha/Beta hydrolase protein [Mucidula mucida]